MSKLLKSLCLAAIFVFFVSFVGYSQTSTATLSGNVEDQTGASLPGASITIKNYATALERTAVTNESGGFTVPLLPPGKYSLIVRRDGFTAVEVPDIVLNVGDSKSISVQLKVGNASATVEVRPDESILDTKTAVNTTIDGNFVSNLPVNARNVTSLVLLVPGVTIVGSNSLGGFSVNGSRDTSNSVSVDGVSANLGINRSSPPPLAAQLPSVQPARL
jgi:hypothetical protein